MVGRTSRVSISWADEVEKEELEEEVKLQIQEKKKPNPFGSATTIPTEIVLQEREINSGILDPHPIVSRKENQLKENVPAPTSHTFDKKQTKPQSKASPRQNIGDPKIASCHYKNLQGSQTYGSIFVPPIRYPPKNLIPYLFPPIRAEPSNPRMGQFRSISITDLEGRCDHLKGNYQYKIELENDVTIISKRRNTSGTEDTYYNRKRK